MVSGKGQTIRNHGRGVNNFSVDEFFSRPVCLHIYIYFFFFFDVEALHNFFSTELLLILKAYKAMHSLIRVPLKGTVSL